MTTASNLYDQVAGEGPAPLTPPARAMTIGAHPDDAEFGAGGTLAKWAAAGTELTILVVSDGSKGTWDPSVSTEALVATRQAEQRRAADALGVDTFIPIGYSMGGAIAQLTWRRHRDRVDGLVLAATAPHYAERRDERLSFLGLTGLAALARVTPSQARDRISDQVYLRRKTETWGPWAVAQAARHDWRMVLEAGRALGNFSSTDWLEEIDVPTSVIVTMRDPVVPLRRQVRLFDRIPGAEAFRVDGEHDAVVANADRFVPTLVRAVDSVIGRLPGGADGRG